MAVFHNPKIETTGLTALFDIGNPKSFRGEPTTNLLPTPGVNSIPTIGNGWGTYNTNQYNSNTYFSIGTVSSVTSNLVTMTTTHPLRTYDVVTPQSSGGGLTAGAYYLVKKVSDTQFTLHAYNSSEDGSQGFINSVTGNHKVYDALMNDVRISVNITSFPTMWWGPPHLPNSGLVKEIVTKGFTQPDTLVKTDSIRLHYIRTDDVKDGMAYNVDAIVTPGQPVTVSFYYKPTDARAVGKSISYQIYNYTGGSATGYSTSFIIGPLGVWQRFTYTITPTYGTIISYWFSQSNGVYSWDMSNIQIEQKSYATAFVAGTRGTTVATGGGLADLSGNSNNSEIINTPLYTSSGKGALVFNGINNYCNIASTVSLGNTCTIIGTIRLSGSNADTSIYGSDANGLDNWFGINNNKLSVFFTQTSDINNIILTGNTTLDTTNTIWYHVALVINTSSAILYLNGVQDGTTTVGFVIGSWTGTGAIGRRGAADQRYFKGAISNLSFYNRQLSAQQILDNFNAYRYRFGI